MQAPELSRAVEPESLFLWQAYHHLRGAGMDAMGQKPIPLSEVSRYSDEVGSTCPIERARLVRVIFAMNNAERAFWTKKAGK